MCQTLCLKYLVELGNYFKRYGGRGIPEEVPLLNGTFCCWKQFTGSTEQLTFEIMFIALYFNDYQFCL